MVDRPGYEGPPHSVHFPASRMSRGNMPPSGPAATRRRNRPRRAPPRDGRRRSRRAGRGTSRRRRGSPPRGRPPTRPPRAAWRGRGGGGPLIASNDSQSPTRRPSSGMSDAQSPRGYPLPSHRSWWDRTPSTIGAATPRAASRSAPRSGWPCISTHWAGLRRPGAVSTASGRPTLPTSCTRPATWARATSSAAHPRSMATRRHSRPTAAECRAVKWSRSSITAISPGTLSAATLGR